MSRKPKDSPLNLIRILPPKLGLSRSNKHHSASALFKIQLDDQAPSGPMPSLHRVTGPSRGLPYVVGKIGKGILNLVKKGLQSLKMLVLLMARGFTRGINKIGQFAKFLGSQFLNLFMELGGRILASIKQIWIIMLPGGKPQVIEAVHKERSKQRDELIEEVHALRNQFSAHQDELIRVTAQLGELKALVLSQQQVILHLGEEIEATENKETPSERSTLRKTKSRPTKSSKAKKSESQESPPPTPFELGPPHH